MRVVTFAPRQKYFFLKITLLSIGDLLDDDEGEREGGTEPRQKSAKSASPLQG